MRTKKEIIRKNEMIIDKYNELTMNSEYTEEVENQLHNLKIMSITLSWVLGEKEGRHIYQDILEEKLEMAREFILGIKTMDIIKPEVIDDIIKRIK